MGFGENRIGSLIRQYPEKKAEFSKFNILIKKGTNGEMVVSRQDLTPMRDDLAQVIEENK